MATSGSVDFSLTRNDIIRQALLKCGVIDETQTLETQQITDCTQILNAFVKRISAKQPLFGVVDYTIPLYDQKQSYTVGPDGNKDINRPVMVTEARRRDSSGNETPVEMIARSEYMELPLKSSTGKVNVACYDKQLTQGVLYVWPVAATTSTTLSDGATDNFTDSGTTPGEYYYTGSDISSEPTFVFADGTELTEGTLGSLANGEYAWGDQDTIGADTLYVKTSAGDPDAQASGYIKVLESTPDKIIITAHRKLEDFDLASNTPDFPQEAYEMLIDNLAARLSAQYAPEKAAQLWQEAGESYQDYMGSDTEDAPLRFKPRLR